MKKDLTFQGEQTYLRRKKEGEKKYE